MEFQMLMYRPLYWLGHNGQPEIDYDLSLAYPPEWNGDGQTVTVTLKPWMWSNGEPVCADNVMFWLNMLTVKADRYGGYSPGCLPDNLTSYRKVAQDKVALSFDQAYSRTWILMNQLTLITPMPRAWDRTADDAPANASGDPADIPAVYDYLLAQNGPWTTENNEIRTRWPDSPVWSVVNGPWRLREYRADGGVTFVPNEHYSGPNKPYLDEFRQVPTVSDDEQYRRLQAGPDGPDALQVGYLPYGLDIGATADSVARHYRVVPERISMIHYMPLNFANPTAAGRTLRQAYVRQALQHCLDQDRAIRDIFHGYGHRTDGPVPGDQSQSAGLPFDLSRARTLLEEHGWDLSRLPAVCLRPGSGPGGAGEGIGAGDRLSLVLRYAAGRAALSRLVRQFQADAAKVGIELRLQEVNGSVMIGEDHGETSPARRTWEIHCWNGGWSFHGLPTGQQLFRTGGASNYGEYSDPEADRLIDATMTSDAPDALTEYHEYLARQVPVIWTPGLPLRVLAVDKDLRGLEPVNPYGLINPENWHYADR
jgi:peptide/nickel transport system substrate-binding protein